MSREAELRRVKRLASLQKSISRSGDAALISAKLALDLQAREQRALMALTDTHGFASRHFPQLCVDYLALNHSEIKRLGVTVSKVTDEAFRQRQLLRKLEEAVHAQQRISTQAEDMEYLLELAAHRKSSLPQA